MTQPECILCPSHVPRRFRLAPRCEQNSKRHSREFRHSFSQLAGLRWQQKSLSSAWTVGQVFVHLTWALEQLPQEVQQARRGKGMFNLPEWLADPASYWYIRWIARRATPQSISKQYRAAMDTAIAALNSVEDHEWLQGADFYAEGFHTIEDLFHGPARAPGRTHCRPVAGFSGAIGSLYERSRFPRINRSWSRTRSPDEWPLGNRTDTQHRRRRVPCRKPPAAFRHLRGNSTTRHAALGGSGKDLATQRACRSFGEGRRREPYRARDRLCRHEAGPDVRIPGRRSYLGRVTRLSTDPVPAFVVFARREALFGLRARDSVVPG